MSNKNTIRAWKDPTYRNSLSEAERAALPSNPAGSVELSDVELGKVGGGIGGWGFSLFCTHYVTCSCIP